MLLDHPGDLGYKKESTDLSYEESGVCVSERRGGMMKEIRTECAKEGDGVAGYRSLSTSSQNGEPASQSLHHAARRYCS